MIHWPKEFLRFLERPVPIFMHVAAAKPGMEPLICRGYGVRLNPDNGEVAVSILLNQWLRLKEYSSDTLWLAVLLTSGTDNESYQLKGTYTEYRALSAEDRIAMEQQRHLASERFPYLLSVVAVATSDCLCVTLQVNRIYVQTPGQGAGALLAERSG